MSKIYEALNRAKEGGGDDGPGGGAPVGVDPTSLSDELREVWSYYEELHSSIDKSLGAVTGYSILFAASVAGEGATTVAVEYASTLGRTIPRGCLLVDADLRSPSLHSIFDIPNENGLSDILAGRCDLKSAVVDVAEGTLSILVAGTLNSSPSTLINTATVSRFLSESKEMFGAVLVDGPPVISCAEATHIAAAADGVVLVVESDRTKREIVIRARDALIKGKANILGIVLNRRRYVIPEFLYRQL